MIELRRDGDVFILHMDNGENRFNADSVQAIHAALDEVDAADGPKALLTTGEAKFYSNGLDLDWLNLPVAAEHPNFLEGVHGILGRILFNEAPTAAAINGHAFAGGAMMAAVHDFRVMREDRGYFCIPEVDLGLPLSTGMSAALQARIPAAALHQAVVTGKRWGAAELLANNMVEATAAEDEVVTAALEWAQAQAHHAGDTLSIMKKGLYPHAFDTLPTDSPI